MMRDDIRELFLGLDEKIKLRDCSDCIAVNFDNAATTPPFKEVIEEINKYILTYGSIGRGLGQKAEITTKKFEECREKILEYFSVKNDKRYTVVFSSNTTDGINKLSKILVQDKSDIVIVTRMEHHSNDLPWRKVATVVYVDVDEKGRLNIDEYERLFNIYCDRIKYITVTGASNVTGYINDIHKIALIAHKHGARIVVDGAQLVPHKRINLNGAALGQEIDYVVFSGHKLYAPFGSGAIVGLRDRFDESLPDYDGGGTVDFVRDWLVKYLPAPERDEAGTPNFFGVVALTKSIEIIDKIGIETFEDKERKLYLRLINGAKEIPKIVNYGDVENTEDRLAIAVFNIEDRFHQDVAEILAKDYGIAVRQGWFCAHPYCRRLMGLEEKEACAFLRDKNKKMQGMFRISIGPYNTEEDIDYLLNVLEIICGTNKK